MFLSRPSGLSESKLGPVDFLSWKNHPHQLESVFFINLAVKLKQRYVVTTLV